MSDEPTDLVPLTPAHFLIGEPLVTLPESGELLDIPDQRLKRWELLQKLFQSFWKRWNEEYLSSLINRPKWNTVQRDFKIGNMVIIKEDNLPPSKWKLGRIVQIFPGSDGHVRTVEVFTMKRIYKRPITKLALLPWGNEEEIEENSVTPDSTIPVLVTTIGTVSEPTNSNELIIRSQSCPVELTTEEPFTAPNSPLSLPEYASSPEIIQAMRQHGMNPFDQLSSWTDDDQSDQTSELPSYKSLANLNSNGETESSVESLPPTNNSDEQFENLIHNDENSSDS